ncbi:MAG TPA: phosphonate metabolism protein/1,5-bisphosphokinase (PRPP-forming) PhnN [Rhabdaerophilum sp.]|nr:phosphonate metabolism protein/1,5-bisphosphokinase (PRPP-forming) PhnN [Rhabdaerophilum sp.]
MDGDVAEEWTALYPGTLIAVVGPSGAGKDTVMRLAREELAGIADIVFAMRVITRPPHPSETYESVEPQEFERREKEGGFLIAWHANGLAYALPVSLAGELKAGKTIVANLSRGAVAAARGKGIRVLAVEVTAERQLLASRIAQRGRENPATREARLARNAAYADTFRADIVIANNEAPDLAAARLSEVIRICAQ